MKNVLRTALLALTAVSNGVHAYEYENAVPLTIGAHLANASVVSIHIQLKGREVEIESRVQNHSNSPINVGFFAITPLFENLGDGEEHADKRFADLTATHNGRAVKTVSNYRAYVLGQDITPMLKKARIDPVPSNDISSQKLDKLPQFRGLQISQWQGQSVHGWTSTIGPRSVSVEAVRYRTLPQFGMEEAGSPQTTQLVLQHCGNPDAIRSLVDPNEQLLLERYELPIQFLKLRDVTLKIEQPAPNWLGATPITSMACGLPRQSMPNLEGSIANANQVISVLVISSLKATQNK